MADKVNYETYLHANLESYRGKWIVIFDKNIILLEKILRKF